LRAYSSFVALGLASASINGNRADGKYMYVVACIPRFQSSRAMSQH
jgi:hypothetical protein